MPLLFASLAVLFIGPLLDRVGRRRPLVLAVIDGFVLVVVAGLVFAEILPEAYGRAGVWVLLAAAAGLFGPRLLEHSRGIWGRGSHALTLLVAVAGLLLHSGIDGMALADAAEAPSSPAGGSGLGLAVILHRIAVAVSVWVIVARERGKLAGGFALAGMGAFTVLGFVLGASWLDTPDARLLGIFEGLVAGSLLHVLLHAETRALAPQKLAAAGGAVAGGGLLYFLVHLEGESAGEGHAHGSWGIGELGQFGDAFLHLALEVAPALALALGIVFVLQVLFPATAWGWFRRGGPATQIAKGLVVGLPLPLCSCGVVPVYRQFARRGVPATAGLTFLVATPEIGVDAVLVSLPLLGFEFTAWRIAAALLTAIAAGWFVGRGVTALGAAGKSEDKAGPQGRLGVGLRVQRAWTEGVLGLFEATAPWIVFGIVLAALMQGLDLGVFLERLPPASRVLVFALAGIPLYVCAAGATPLVAVLIAQGVSPGAALAFLLTGPATNATTFGVLASIHGRGVAFRFGLVVFMVTVGLGYALDALVPGLALPALDHLARHDASALDWASLGFISALLLLILVRTGPRGLLGMILPWAADGHTHNHAHGQDDGGSSSADCCSHS